jgi:xanthine dehydrogenase YagS FAD-binding subunit
MRTFNYRRLDNAEAFLADRPASSVSFIAGGTTLLDLMKLDVMQPSEVVDINALSRLPAFGAITFDAHGVRLGALVRMSDAADHAGLRKVYPVIAQSLDLAASQQLRNMASLGGNILQRTRCPYFRDTSWKACNKRDPGSGCAAMQGFNRMHAVLGDSGRCIATYPGDFAQALLALDAQVEIAGSGGTRQLAFGDLHARPGETPHIETTLVVGELIRAFHIPSGAWTRRSTYVKIRDRESYEFALASAAVALHLEDDIVKEARIALGGVATVPWRAREAEVTLVGKTLNESTAKTAAEAAFGPQSCSPWCGRRSLWAALGASASRAIDAATPRSFAPMLSSFWDRPRRIH